ASTCATTTATARRHWSGSRPSAGRTMTTHRASRSCCPKKIERNAGQQRAKEAPRPCPLHPFQDQGNRSMRVDLWYPADAEPARDVTLYLIRSAGEQLLFISEDDGLAVG